MPKSREELKKLLDALDARMPSLIQANPLETEFWRALSCASDGITEDAGPFDYDWLSSSTMTLLCCLLLRIFSKRRRAFWCAHFALTGRRLKC